MRVKLLISIRASRLQYVWTKNTDLAISPSELFYKSRLLNLDEPSWWSSLEKQLSPKLFRANAKTMPWLKFFHFAPRTALLYWRSKFGGNSLFPTQFAVTSLHHTPSWRNVWTLVRNFSVYIDIHTPLWKAPTLLSLLWYSALVRWRHNRRPRNYRFIQWGSKTDAKKRHFPNEFRKMLSQDFYWVIEDCFSLLLLRIGRHGFLHRSAALKVMEKGASLLHYKDVSWNVRTYIEPLKCDQREKMKK